MATQQPAFLLLWQYCSYGNSALMAIIFWSDGNPALMAILLWWHSCSYGNSALMAFLLLWQFCSDGISALMATRLPACISVYIATLLWWLRSSPIRAVSLHFCSYGNAAALYGQLACISALMATQHSCYSMQFLWFPVVCTKKIDRRNLPFDEWFQDFNTFEITHQIRGHATVCSNGGASHQGEHKGNIRVRETSEIYNDPRDR